MVMALAIGALALTGSAPAEAGGGCHNGVFSDMTGAQVELSKNCFEPTVVRIQQGQQVTWTNNDPDPHAVTGAANSWGMTGRVGKGGEEIDPGKSVSYQFDNSGVFPYFCIFHPSMAGAVVVGDGRAVSSGASAGDGVSAVSALAPGGDATNPRAASASTDSGDGVAVWLVIGIGALAAMGGFVAAFVLRRKSTPS
jgi:plastocyanin